jgi:hypothetical protein
MAASSKKKGKKRTLFVLLFVMASIFLGAYVILFCALIVPTLLCWLTDRDKGKRMTTTVGALNLIGILPILFQLWKEGGDVSQSFALIGNLFSWASVLLATLVGWVMAQVIPPLIVGVITARDRMKIDRLRARQKALTEEWGPDVNDPTAG